MLNTLVVYVHARRVNLILLVPVTTDDRIGLAGRNNSRDLVYDTLQDHNLLLSLALALPLSLHTPTSSSHREHLSSTDYLLPPTYHLNPYSTYLAQPNYPADDDDNYTQVISLARYPADDDDNHPKD